MTICKSKYHKIKLEDSTCFVNMNNQIPGAESLDVKLILYILKVPQVIGSTVHIILDV